MTLKTPKVASTRLSLPLGVAGAEPADAAVGTLAFATDTDKVRVYTSAGWDDVGSGTGGPPTGPAGGDLGGTYPNPTVMQARGLKSATTTVSVSAATAPSSGQVLTATGSTAATWQTPSGSPTGSAGGDLSGTYPNPSVAAIHETSGPTQLVFGSITAGQLLVRSGTTVVGQTGAAPTGSAGGDLSGTYPNPSVVTSGALKSATTNVVTSAATAPTSGQVLTATSTTAATWQTPSGSPTGAAGGDLSGTYPNPAVAKITTTTGPTSLTVGAIADGDILSRSGSSVVGFSISGLTRDTRANPEDQFLVGDYENAYAKRRMPLWMFTNPFVRPPRVASSDDIEAYDFPQNLGLSIYNTTDSTTPTFSGDADAFTTLLTDGTKYRAANGAGISWFQGADAKRYVLHKALAAAVSSGVNFFWTSIIPPPIDLTALRTATAVPPKPVIALFLSKTASGLPDASNQIVVGWRDNGGRTEAYATTVIAAASTNYLSVSALVISPVADILGIAINTTDNWCRPFLASSDTGQAYFWTDSIAPGNSFMLSLDRWGLVAGGTAGTAFGTNNMTGFRFMRRKPTSVVDGGNNNWIAGF